MKNFLTLKMLLLLLAICQHGALAQAFDPCANTSPISCGVSTHTSLVPGTGAFSFYIDGNNSYFGVSGQEKIYVFTPVITGKYTLTITNTNSYGAYYFLKPTSAGCNPYSWTNIGYSLYAGPLLYMGILQGGTTYYVMLDAASDYYGAEHDFTINCAENYNACSSIIPVTCNNDIIFSATAGTGGIELPSCAVYNNYPDLGKETIYSFTPTTSGRTSIVTTLTPDGAWYTYYYKNATAGCNATGWNCLGGAGYIYSPYYSAPFDVVSGNTYLIMVDVNSMSGTSQTFHLSCPETFDACATIGTLNCEVPVTAVLDPGFGSFDTVGQFCNPYYSQLNTGKEAIYSFTATVTGIHRLDILSTNYYPTNFMYKVASSGCNATEWKCIGSGTYPTSLFTSSPLTAGVTYLFMVDATTVDGATSEFVIHCDPPFDPCPLITNISCGIPVSYNLPEGTGGLDTYVDSWLVEADGKESIYEFTATVSGTHMLHFSAKSGSGGIVFAFVKEAGSGCNENGWTLIGQPPYFIPGTIPIPIPLLSGNTYYLMFDSYANNYPPGSSATFEIICPAVAYDPCPVTIIPGCVTTMTTLHSAGVGYMSPFPPPGGFAPPAYGTENLFSFTPSITGKYKFMADSLSGTGSIIYSIKQASGGCNESGWKYIGEFSNEYTNYEVLIPLELQSGTTYYILADASDSISKSQTFFLTCPVAYNPCTITPITCGDYMALTFPAGNGAWSSSCNIFFPQGSELILSFTPEESGIYHFEGSGYPSVYMYVKEAALGCNSSGWICFGTELYSPFSVYTPITLQQGVPYYFMFQGLYETGGFGYLAVAMNCQASCTVYADSDGDGFGNASMSYSYCGMTYPGYSSNNNDCNDSNDDINPVATEICSNNLDDDCDGQIDEGCGCGMTVNSGVDESTFFGYAADQIVTHTAIVSGGTPPYNYSWTINRPIMCNQVNSAGDEIFMLGTCINNACPSSGQLVNNPVCNGSSTIKVKLMDTTQVCVTVTDGAGCIVTDCFMVNATDARCFAGNSNNSKVKVCHHTGNASNPWVQICVAEEAVANLVAQGDYVGNCILNRELSSYTESSGLNIELFPNPTEDIVYMNFYSKESAMLKYQITDLTGRVIISFENMTSTGNNNYEINLESIRSGIYYVVVNIDNQQTVKKLAIEK